MNSFNIKFFGLVAIVIALFGYNSILDSREKNEEIDKLEYQLKNSNVSSNSQTVSNEQSSLYNDGTYTGKGDGFGGKIEVEVVVKDGLIAQINILSADGEDKSYFKMAESITDDMVAENSYDVDVVSGATFSSNGIKDAVKQSLGKAEK